MELAEEERGRERRRKMRGRRDEEPPGASRGGPGGGRSPEQTQAPGVSESAEAAVPCGAGHPLCVHSVLRGRSYAGHGQHWGAGLSPSLFFRKVAW